MTCSSVLSASSKQWLTKMTLLSELTHFSAHLRRAGFSVSVGDVADALRAAEHLGLLDFEQLTSAWTVIFARTPAQAQQFGALLRAHFLLAPNAPELEPAADQLSLPETAEESSEPTQMNVDTSKPTSRNNALPEDSALEDSPAKAWLQMRLSPYAALATPPVLTTTQDETYNEAARALLRAVRLGNSRRNRPALLGQRVDLRATLRAARQTGGEPLRLRHKGRPPRPVRVVLLLDGSRSMTPYAALLLRYAAALSTRSRKVEVYSFSTSLTHLTPLLRSERPLSADAWTGEGWGGGTRIAENMKRLLSEGKAALRPNTLLLILSDGLDTGEPRALAEALKQLHAKVGAVIWLNPLAAQAGYQPLALGMAAALPYLDVFTGVASVDDLLSLPSKVRRALR